MKKLRYIQTLSFEDIIKTIMVTLTQWTYFILLI